MRLKLKEEPREWQKFTLTAAVAAAGASVVLFFLRRLPAGGLIAVLVFLCLILILSLVKPRLFRGAYRAGTTASFHAGQLMGRVMLSILFIIVVTPLGLLLRLFGKDLLRLRRQPNTETYWQPARESGPLDRLF